MLRECADQKLLVQELKTALTGWKAYFGIAEVLSPLREIDK